jgi:hypothetical protein
VLVVLVNFSSLITAINVDSDAVVAPVIGKLLGGAPSGTQVLLGNHAWYEELWFLRATSGLPHYRQLWDVAPAGWSVLGLAVLSWAAWKALGAWAAAFTASALVCLGGGARFMFFTFNWHGLTAFHTILIAALLVWLVGRVERLQPWQLLLIALGAGVISAAPAAGDELFLYWALVPMLATTALLVWRARSPGYWRLLAVAVGVALVAEGGGALLRHAMRDHGWLNVPQHVSFIEPGALVSNLVLLVHSYLYLAGGQFFGSHTDFPGVTVFVSGALFLLALAAVVAELRRRTIAATPAPSPIEPQAARSFVYIVFWATSLAISSAAFVLSSATVDVNSSRFLLAGYIAFGALLPLLALRSRGWQASLVAGLCAFALIASYQIVRQPFAPQNRFPTAGTVNRLVRLAQSQRVTYGYASYWDAPDITWLSYFKLPVYPIEQCAPPNLTLCPFSQVRVSSWYAPRPHTRSMLIVDPQLQRQLVSAPDPALGKPDFTTTIGTLSVYIYPYDIAQRFHPAL